MKNLFFGAIVALAWSTAAVSKEPAPPPPAPQPDFLKVRQTAEATAKAGLYDPDSAQIVYTSGFQWGYAKPLLGKRTWGWIACATLNAKNRLGGYVGASPFWIMSDANGTISTGPVASNLSTCDNGQKAELQPELVDGPGPTIGNAKLGVADELGKLADLREKGVITQAEFDAQKVKLLAR